MQRCRARRVRRCGALGRAAGRVRVRARHPNAANAARRVLVRRDGLRPGAGVGRFVAAGLRAHLRAAADLRLSRPPGQARAIDGHRFEASVSTPALRVFTIAPGTFFADDPVFKGRRRESSTDYVYSFKRFFDPRLHSDNLYLFEAERMLGMAELRRKGDRGEVAAAGRHRGRGLRALDRYRLEIRLAAPSPWLPLLFTYARRPACARARWSRPTVPT